MILQISLQIIIQIMAIQILTIEGKYKENQKNMYIFQELVQNIMDDLHVEE